MTKPVYCHGCLYFQPLYDNKGEVLTYGDCRRYPPELIGGDSCWPNVRHIEWCGEYRSEADR